MRYRNVKYYLIGIIGILILVHIYMKVYRLYLEAWPPPNSAIMHELSLFSVKHFGEMCFSILLGMVFGLESFLKDRYKTGRWHIDFKRLLIIGVPALLLSIEAIHFFLLDHILWKIGLPYTYLIAPAREPFFRFLAGYTIITSFYKES